MWVEALRFAVAPILVATAIAATVAAERARIPPLLFFAVGGSIAMGALAVLERAMPASAAWRRHDADFVADLCHFAVTGGLVETLPALALGSPFAGAWTRPPWPVEAAVVFVLTDLASYWTHRLFHGPLWRVHQVHHAATRLWWLNSWRVHPIEGVVYFCTSALPLALLGASPRVLVVVWSATTIFRMIQHSNVDVRLGVLNRVFAGPELHRWHHAEAAADHHANFGTTLSVWDHLFGTLRLHASAPGRLGIAGLRQFPHGYLGQLAAPFRAASQGDERDAARVRQ
jgi:ornithine lipid hydroxylase